jgi:hypothetical protein
MLETGVTATVPIISAVSASMIVGDVFMSALLSDF